jgi:hypothetical protein
MREIKMIMIIIGCLLAFQYQLAAHRMNMQEMADEQTELYAMLNEVTTRMTAVDNEIVDLVKQSKDELLAKLKEVTTQATDKRSGDLVKNNSDQFFAAKLIHEVYTQMAAKDMEIVDLVKQNKDELSAKVNEVANRMAAVNNEDWQKESSNLQKLLSPNKMSEELSTSSIKERALRPTDENRLSSAPGKEVANLVSDVNTKTTGKDAENYPSYPETKYTQHIKELLHVIDDVTLHLPDDATNPWPFDPHKYCTLGYHIFVDKPYSPPTVIECNPDNVWCKFFLRLFEDSKRILPYNVSVGESQADMIKTSSMAWGQCFASSGPGGGFSMNNFQDAKAQIEDYNSSATGYVHMHNRKWEKRYRVPVFRGHPRMPNRPIWEKDPSRCPNGPKNNVENGEYGHRARAVLFSLDNPNLLNARVSNAWHSCLVYNATNGMDRVFGWGKHKRDDLLQIPSSDYYTDYQVALVLAGIGAAFRTTTHLSAGQAVVLQRFYFEEWFVPYMTPWENYIPLKEDLSDLKEIMEWVRKNVKKVKSIAENGKKFYDEWLSFPQTNEHWHELLWRLSELIYHKGPERLKTGTVRTIWPGPIVPSRFVRDPKTGKFVEEERSKTRQPYLDYDVPRGEKTQD